MQWPNVPYNSNVRKSYGLNVINVKNVVVKVKTYGKKCILFLQKRPNQIRIIVDPVI